MSRPLAPLRLLLTALLLTAPSGCATFSYERARAPAEPAAQCTGLRLGVARFSQPDPATFYPIRFGNTLADPIGDISRAVAQELGASGVFADVVYLGVPPPAGADLAYYREVYRLDAILTGEVTTFYVTSVPELWSLVTPWLALWPLHALGLPTAPCHDSVALAGTLGLQGLAPGAPAWRSAALRLDWHEHNWYSSLTIPSIERALQTRALDHFVASLADAARAAIAAGRWYGRAPCEAQR